MNSFQISGNVVDLLNWRIYGATIVVIDGKITEIVPQYHIIYNTFIMPGFIDSHIHIESSMLTPAEFGRLASVHGTVATVSDPHEIANVLGLDGVRFMIENARLSPIKTYFGAPSCVPATSFETSGAAITASDIATLFDEYGLKYLSELMNFPGVLYDFPDVMEKIEVARTRNLPIDGHAPGLGGDNLKKYVSAGITTDHEAFTIEEAREKIACGMKILIREGSAAKNYDALSHLISENPEMCMFCSDDKHPDDLVDGHINLILKKSTELGYNILDLLRIASLNPIMHYSLDVGLIQVGDDADFIVIDNFRDFNVKQTYIKGNLVAENGASLIEQVASDQPNQFNITAKSVQDFTVKPQGRPLRAIEALNGELITNMVLVDEKVENGNLVSDVENDILKITVINRYNDAAPAIGFVKNFGLERGAIATSVAHDSHNIIAVGTSDEEITCVVNAVIEHRGGMVVSDGDQISVLPLPIAGLMSPDDGYEVARKYKELDAKAHELGCALHSPFMTLSFMALLVIPKIKLSDKGLFDGEKFEFIDLHE